MDGSSQLDVVGAGPAGLAAAITAARSGLEVVVHEKAARVGSRFHGDFQGLENWTTDRDVLQELTSAGIEPCFDHAPFREQVVFGPDGVGHRLRSEQPFYYLVRRGPGPGTLDQALLAQAREAGVEVRFRDPVESLPGGGIVAHGPRRTDVVAVGYTFDTELDDGAWAALGEDIAPGGYAYLLAWNGRGTLAVCLFRDFHREKLYLQRAVELFRERVGLRWEDERPFGGAGGFRLPATAVRGNLLVAGEAAGFQDPLWGFGMRYALLSGHLAARAWLEGDLEAYDGLWKGSLGGLMRAGAVNRALYALFADRGYRLLVRSFSAASEPRSWLRRRCTPSWKTRLLYPLLRERSFPTRESDECGSMSCACTWCRCRRRTAVERTGG
ncbi:MAG: NAD(P)/FAD-dependent oxidoreductase [Acidobacteria bacterium]|nr:NAD(P)/FAD-dependent oxidoreductase [Acidobacteriota bacterium]